MSKLRKILQGTLLSFGVLVGVFLSAGEIGEIFCHQFEGNQKFTLHARMVNASPITDTAGPKSLCHLLPPNNSFIEVS